MIEVKELRIGNLLDHCNNRVGIVDSIIQDNSIGYYITVDKQITSLNEAKPIPLTEEWLLKFGFEKSFNACLQVWFYTHKNIKGLYVRHNEYGYALCTNKTYLFRVREFFDSVHKLQNLYFALTGEELTYTK